MQPLADLVEPCIGEALQEKGFSQSGIVLYWPDIVGSRLAEFCEPMTVQWPVRRQGESAPASATLVVRVEGGFALELQHLAPLLVERVNSHLGWRCIGRLVLKQGPLLRRTQPRQPKHTLSAAALTCAAGAAEGIEAEELRAALTRLGARIFARSTG
jgi:hypothetical protein